MKRRWILIAWALPFVTGCQHMQQPAVLAAPPAAPATQTGYLNKAAVQYDPENKTDSAVDSAVVWSERYAQSMERIVQIQNAKTELEQRNKELEEQLTKARLELAQCQKELADANELLLAMRKELDQWKSNVLGFRDEMRTAQRAQLDATAKVIRLLGGEAGDVAAASQPAKAPPASAIAP